MPSYPIYLPDPSLQAQAQALSQAIAEPLTTTQPSGSYLILDQDGLRIHCHEPELEYQVDFCSAQARHRQQTSGKKQLIARACGVKFNRTCVDLTAGFGRDGFVLANCGFEVTLVEQHPIIAQLLNDGLQRLFSKTPALQTRLHWVHARAEDYLSALTTRPDVIYLDPMFAMHSRAQVKKDMQIARHLAGDVPWDEGILPRAIESVTNRVVVKRHRNSELLSGLTPSVQLSSRVIRYDIYYP